MSLGEWNPNAEAEANDYQLDFELLANYAALMSDADSKDLTQSITNAEVTKHAALMLKDRLAWQRYVDQAEDQEVIQLIRFLTLAEEQLPGWEAGAESPVIKLNKLLRKRGVKLDRDLLVWIKANSTNQYLPNGAVLL